MNKSDVVPIIFLIVFIIGGIFLANVILDSDLPGWLKFIMLI